jgi:amino acid permease
VVATYIGVAMYIILFCGYLVYERFYEGKKRHFIPKAEVDLATDAVWKPGQGDMIRAQDEKNSDKSTTMKSALWRVLVSRR